MAVRKSEDSTPLIKPESLSSIRACYKHIHLYQYPFCVCIFLFMLYKVFPSLFFFILRSSPLFAITSLLLAALLTYGERETNSLETCSRDNNSRINTALLPCEKSETNILESCSRNNDSQINTDHKCCQSPTCFESDVNSENQHEEKRNHEKERFLRLSSLIERRRARMSIRHEIKRNLIDPDGEAVVDDASDYGDRFSPVTIPSWDPFADQNSSFSQVPGSAPSILHHRKTPFEKLLPGTASFSRLDPYFITEMDLVEKRDASASLTSDHANIKQVLGVELQDDQKKLNLKNKLNIHGEGNTSAMDGNVNKPEIGGDNSGNGFLNADNLQLETKEAVQTEIEKDLVSGQENGTSSYCDTLMLSEYLNLCSSGILPPRKKHTLSGRFPMVKLEESEIESIEEKVQNPFDGTSNGVCGAGALDQENVKFDLNGEHNENLEVKEQKVNNAHDGSCNWVSDRRELVLETVKIEENGENDKSLELEEDGNSVKEVKSILKQVREELVKADPNSVVVPKSDHETHELVSDETGMKLLSEPKVVKEGRKDGEDNGSVTSDSDVAPDGPLGRFSRLDSITSNLKMLRKQNKHGESSSSSSDDFD